MRLFPADSSGPRALGSMEHRNRDGLSLGDSDRGYLHQPGCTKHPCITSPTRSLQPLPSLAGRAMRKQPIHHQLPRTREQNKDKREKPQDLQFSPGASARKQSSRREECKWPICPGCCVPAAAGTCLGLSFQELLLLGAGGLFVSFTLSPGLVTAWY